jgi:hypothetical protein
VSNHDSSWGWFVITTTVVVVIVAFVVQHDHENDGAQQQQYSGLYYGVISAILCATYSLYRILSRRYSHQFIEASIEITESVVQLVSTFGTPSYSSPPPSLNSTSPSSQKHQYQQKQRRRASIVTIQKNNQPSNNNVVSDTTTTTNNNNNNMQHHIHHKIIHAQIPHTDILDVIVMEIVWPHCVWSQVAFRVRNTMTVKANGDGASRRTDGLPNEEQETGQPVAAVVRKRSKFDDRNDANPQRHLSASSSSQAAGVVQQLLEKSEVSIVPAFPSHDCHGMLSYEECLLVQAEIEKLLGM